MKNILLFSKTTVFALIILCFSCSEKKRLLVKSSTTAPITENFNLNWEFKKQGTWAAITLPHTPKVEPLIVNNQWQGTCFYQKKFELQPEDGYEYFLEFEGVMNHAIVSLNGHELTQHYGGYLPFVVDITQQLKGQNLLAVKVINTNDETIPPGKPLETLDFNYYGGIYRDVHLIKKRKLHISHPILANKVASGGILIHFDQVTEKLAKGTIKTHIVNHFNEAKEIQLDITLTAPDGKTTRLKSHKTTLNTKEDKAVSLSLEIAQPSLWSPTQPNLYQVQVTVADNQEILDQETLRAGIRSIDLQADGFYINGKKTFLNGTNRHQEYPYVGYAISNHANYRDAIKIKNAGFDMVRLSHYPQDPSFLDACDELGIVVMNAIPGWQFYADGLFVDRSIQEIRDMVRRDRNHPSVFFWEVSLNESGMTDAYMIAANKALKEELPFKDTYSAGWIDHPTYDLFIPARQHGKAPDYYNFYKEGKRPIFIAEYGDWEYYAHNAGFNQTAFEGLQQDERTSRQLRAHGEKRLLQQAFNFQEAANSNLKGNSTIGMANWLMFDYNRGYADDLEASGIADIFRNEKFAFYFYQSQRSPYEQYHNPNIQTGPMVKIASYWNETSPSNIRVYSNCEEVALFLNGQLIEKTKPTRNQFNEQLAHPPFEFKLPKFTKGTLSAKGYIEGKEVCNDAVTTADTASQLSVSLDLTGIETTETTDVIIVHAKALDKAGNFVADFDQEVFFNLKGSGILIGENPVKAEAGIASIIVKTAPNQPLGDIKATFVPQP